MVNGMLTVNNQTDIEKHNLTHTPYESAKLQPHPAI